MENDHADDAEEQAQAMEGNQDDDGPTAAEGQGTVKTFYVYRVVIIKTVSEAVRENRPGVLKRLIEEGKSDWGSDGWGWTALHHAAFLGHTECLRILLNQDTCEIDNRAHIDGSTPLMVACQNMPKSKDCIKVLCEYKANQKTKCNYRRTALDIAMLTKPDLEVVKWLVRSGADVEDERIMEDLFKSGNRKAVLLPGEYLDEYLDEMVLLKADETEVANIAMYLARHGFVKNALRDLLFYNGRIVSPQLLEKVVECFLDNGAVLNTKKIFSDLYGLIEHLFCPAVLSLYAQKSIIFLEGLLASFQCGEWPTGAECGLAEEELPEKFNVVTVLIIKGQACGNVSLAAVKEEHNKLLQSEHACYLPPNFRPLETLDAMSQNPPSLSQLARTEIRAQMAKCEKFSRENLKKLPLPEKLKDLVQLADLGDGSEFNEIMKEAREIMETIEQEGYD